MQSIRIMNTQNFHKRRNRLDMDPIYNLQRELKIREFSFQIQKAYLYYIKNLLKYNSKSAKNINSYDMLTA